MDMRNFTQKLKDYRKQNNLTQSKFAELIGISENYYSLLERGRRTPSLKLLITISDITCISFFDFIEYNTIKGKALLINDIINYIINLDIQEKNTVKNFLNVILDLL